eukprot:462448-Rhodomonas_salina.1
MHCPHYLVPAPPYRSAVPSSCGAAIRLRACYAMSGIELAYGGPSSYRAMSYITTKAHAYRPGITLRARYATPGTDVVY